MQLPASKKFIMIVKLMSLNDGCLEEKQKSKPRKVNKWFIMLVESK